MRSLEIGMERTGGPRLVLAWLVALLLLLLLLLPVAAQAAQAHLEVAAESIQVGQTIPLKLLVVDGQADTVPEIRPGPSARVVFQGQAKSFVSRNFKTTRIVTYQYMLTALAPGPLTIGPVTVQARGERLVAPAIVIEVLPRDQTLQSPMDVTAELVYGGEPVEEAWAGQTMLYRFRFRHREPVRNARWSSPEFTGFGAEPTAEQAQREYQVVDGGHTITVHEILVPLLANTPGVHEIGPATITAHLPTRTGRRRGFGSLDDIFDLGFGGLHDARTESLGSEALQVQVRDLPRDGRPENFTGLVGAFRVQVEPLPSQVALGDSVTLTVHVEGDGTLAGLGLPPLEEGGAFRAYDDSPEITGEVGTGGFRGRATLRRALVPTDEGTFHVPPMELTWFDPSEGDYRVRRLDLGELQVLPGEGGDVALSSFVGDDLDIREDVASLGDDILSAHLDIQPRDHALRLRSPLPWALAGLPGLLLVGTLLVELGARSRSRGGEVRAVRQRLRSLPAEPRERLAALEAAFRMAVALATSTGAAAVDRRLIRTHLSGELASRCEGTYRRLSNARYGAGDQHELEDEVCALVTALLEEVS